MSAIQKKARLSIDCSTQERTQIKIAASLFDMSITEFVMQCVKKEIEQIDLAECHLCKIHGREPNAETVKALEESERGEGLNSYDSVEEMFKEWDKRAQS